MKMILAVALALGGMSTSTAAGAKDDPAAGAFSTVAGSAVLGIEFRAGGRIVLGPGCS